MSIVGEASRSRWSIAGQDAIPAGRVPFARPGSIVRRIWGNADTVLLVFAGAAAEFALNREVDWLFFTGRLPDDPIGRLFSTAAYTGGIVFADVATATRTLERIRMIHSAVERDRGQRIPDHAHRDVLYMLIDYSQRAHELLNGPLSDRERDELYDVFLRVGEGLRIPELPQTYAGWAVDREQHMHRDLVRSGGTMALYAQYRRHLGAWRYRLLLRLQGLMCPDHVRTLLDLPSGAVLRPLVRLYPLLVRMRMRPLIQWLLMPAAHLDAVRRLDRSGSESDHEAQRR